jgi:VCBS repeat-containing protein
MLHRYRNRIALRTTKTRSIESLEQRCVLAAPVAIDDSYTFDEDTTVATQLALVDSHFTATAESFSYADDVFGTNQPSLAGGTYQVAGGFAGGGLRVRLEPANTASRSGAWSAPFTLPAAATVTISLRHRLVMGPGFESDEFGQAILSIDGTRYGTNGNNYLSQLAGASGTTDTQWQQTTLNIPLSAGAHTLHLGAYLNKSTADDEWTEASFDDVVLSFPGGAANLLANDTDADGNPLTAAKLSDPAHGTLTFAANGAFAYTPNPEFSGTDSFTYRANDGTSNSNVATVTFHVTAVNDAPLAKNDFYPLIAGTTLTIPAANGLLANDRDAEQSPLIAVNVAAPVAGSLTVLPTGGFTYTPSAGFTGDATFTYQASDGALLSPATTVTLRVLAANTPPFAVNDTYGTPENQPLEINLATPGPAVDVYANDFNTPAAVAPGVSATLGGPATTVATQGYENLGPAGNRFDGLFLQNSATGNPAQATTLTFSNLPAHNALDVDFLLGIIDSWDGNNGSSSPDRFNLTVDGVSAFSETFDFQDSFDQSYVAPSGGILADRTALGFSGQWADSAYNMAIEPRLSSIPHTASTLTLSFFASGTGWEGGTNESWAIDNLHVKLLSETTDAVQFIAGGSTWRYLDDGSNQGSAWTATAFDDSAWKSGAAELGYGDDADGRPETTPISFGPDANNKFVTTYFRQQFDVDRAADIASLKLELMRDDGAAVYLNGVEIARDNLAAAAAYRTFANGPVPNTDEAVFFPFTIDPARLVDGVNTIAVEIHQASASSTDVSFDLKLSATKKKTYGVLGNDTDAEALPLTAQLVSGPAHGVLGFNADGTFLYTPATNFTGADAFTYIASDGLESSNLGTVTITVRSGPNLAPAAVADGYSVNEDQPLVVPALAGVLANDTDPELDGLTAILAAAPASGSLQLQADGSFTYTPAANFFGDVSFTYVANDGSLTSAAATVTIHVAPQPDSPTAAADNYFVPAGGALNVGAATGVLANDIDPDGDSLTAILIAGPTHGSFSFNPDGSYNYTPAAGFAALDSFTYFARDATGRESSATTVSITVNATPIVGGDSYTTTEDAPLVVALAQGVLTNDSDSDHDVLTAVVDVPPAHGVLALQFNGSFTYTPTADYFGADSFTYRANDGLQNSAPATVSLSVTAVPDAPISAFDSYTGYENTPLSVPLALGVLANDHDVDSAPITAELLTDVQHGTLALAPNGSFTYTSTTDYTGPDFFMYRATDGALTSPPTTVSLNVLSASQLIVINEIRFHPAHTLPTPENTAAEFIELKNISPSPIDVTGWQFTKGVSFTLPAATVPGNGYLVVAANVAAFQTLHPGVTNVVGGWTGTLSNSGEEIELSDPLGTRIDHVEYFDEGDWADRRLLPDSIVSSVTGWQWVNAADGGGRTIELVNSALSNNEGQNWRPSTADGGTPGAANSVASANIAPMILDVAHTPAVPKSTDQVTVTAQLADESAFGLSAELLFRVSVASPGAFTATAMFDDGLHGDAAAGDGLFGAILPEQAAGTIVEFYVHATDAAALGRTYPAPTDSQGAQGANMLYQVDDAVYGGDQPVYHLIMTAAEQQKFANINRNSNAEMNITFVAQTGAGTSVRYSAGMRVRGASSRFFDPVGMKVGMPRDRAWNNTTEFNLNSHYTWLQTTGSAFAELSGVVAAKVKPVQVRLNGANQTNSGSPQYGSYVQQEAFGSEFLDEHLPEDNDGNLYKKVRPDNKWAWRNGNVGAYVNDGWSKGTNESSYDWSDLDNFLKVMNQASGPTYYDQVSQVADLAQFSRFFAYTTIINHYETNISNGADDDYQMYRGADGRFILLPHDFDTIFSQGDSTTSPNATIFQAAEGYVGQGTFPSIVKLFKDPTFLAMYYADLAELCNTVFAPAQFDAMIDNLIGGWVPANVINDMKSFVAQRRTYILGQLPQALTATSNLGTQNGYLHTTNPSTTILSGRINAETTRSVTVAGTAVNVDPYARTWTTSADAQTTTQTIVPYESTWKYLADGSDQGTAWRAAAFDDAAWPSGAGQLGYGDGDEATVVPCSATPAVCNSNNYITTYFRKTISVPNATQFASLKLNVRRDDGVAVFINGSEVARDNLPADAAYDRVATNFAQDDGNTPVTFNIPAGALTNGTNVIAVEIHQSAITSTDVSFDLELTGAIPTGASSIPLAPGVNHVAVDANDAAGAMLERQYLDIWYDDGTTTDVSGTIAADTTWISAAGPYHVTGNLVVPTGVTLTIQPGTSVYFEAGASLTINGRLVAEGTDAAWIRFTRTPGISGTWDGVQFVGTQQDNRISYAVLEYAQPANNNGMVGLTNSRLTVEHSLFDHAERRRIRSVDSSLVVRNSMFADVFAADVPPTADNFNEHIWGFGIPAGGQWLIENNVFGVLKGDNDGIDFDSNANTAATGVPVAQIVGNTFRGGGDDALDMTGDVYIEGNTFQNFIKDQYNLAPGDANAISSSGGVYTVVRNAFFNVQHVELVKEGASSNFTNNSVSGASDAAIYFDVPGQTSGPGIGATVESSIFANVPTLFDQVLPATQLTVHHSLVPAAELNRGVGNLDIASHDPRLANPAGGDFTLLAGSAAAGAGANGRDIGSAVPRWASISGEPAATTPLTSATLTVRGPGITHYRYRLDAAGYGAETPVASPIALAGLSNGPHVVHVIAKNAAGVWQEVGSETASQTWTVDPSHSAVRINEILASNVAAVDHEGTHPDLIELYNSGTAAVDLGGWSLTDDADEPGKFVFPANTILAPSGYLVLYADDAGTSGLHTGFKLQAGGDDLYLYDGPIDGPAPTGVLVDSVVFGLQVADYSIGRSADGTWALDRPTPAAVNVAQSTASPLGLKLNEWLAATDRLYRDDRIELFNPDVLPVALDGVFITDKPIDNPFKHAIAPLSFIAGSGHLPLIPDENSSAGADHLNFKLDPDYESLALFTADETMIDQVLFWSQRTDTSQGRAGDGALSYTTFFPPNIGETNPTSQSAVIVHSAFGAAWKYNAAGVDLGTAWKETAFDDGSWSSGAGPLGSEGDPIPVPVATNLPSGRSTYYFRKHVQIDNPSDAAYLLKMQIDDGAVVYINGVEVLRLGMPAGDVGYTTASGRSVSNAVFEGPFVLPSGAFVAGDNVIAVEVHNITLDSTDIVFGLELSSTISPNALRLLDQLRVTEVMYNPAGSSDDEEYIELQNLGPTTINLAGVEFVNGIEFTFPDVDLPPNEYIVVVKDRAAFETQYGAGIRIAGEFSGSLNNAGEEIDLELPEPYEHDIQSFTYDDAWYPTTDGDGPSIVVVDPSAADLDAWNNSSAWRVSGAPFGSPGSADPIDGIAPHVTRVLVSGADWTGAYITSLALQGLGDGGYALGQNGSPLPWSNLNRVTVVFSEPVTINAGALDLLGVNTAAYATLGSPVAVGNQVTWTFADKFTADRLRLLLGQSSGSIVDGAGNALVPFEMHFDVLPGDVNASGAVGYSDIAFAQRGAFANSTGPGYDALRDVNGDGLVNVVDLIAVRNAGGTSLPPAGSPAASAAAIVSSVRRPATAAAAGSALRATRRNIAIATDAALAELETPPASLLRATRSGVRASRTR